MYNKSSGKALSTSHQEKDKPEEKKQQRNQVLTTSLGESILQSTEEGNARWPVKASPVKTRETVPSFQIAVPVKNFTYCHHLSDTHHEAKLNTKNKIFHSQDMFKINFKKAYKREIPLKSQE